MDRMQIVDYLAKKVFNGELTEDNYYIMLKNRQIYGVSDYDRLIESNKISPQDAFVYISFNSYSKRKSYDDRVDYLFPLIDPDSIDGIVQSYLSKLGFYKPYNNVYPATGLKYYGAVRLFLDRLVTEIVDIDTVVNNIGLGKIVAEVLGKGILTQEELGLDQIRNIIDELQQQKLLAGYNFGTDYIMIDIIIENYYLNHDTSLAKEVLAITDAYNRIFQPYRVVYDTSTRQQVLM